MAIIKTLKHEMEYDTETKQAIFNGRNRTALAPTQDPFPARMLAVGGSSDVEDNTLVLAPATEIEENTMVLSSESIDEHTLVL